MRVLDLYSGTESVAKAFRARGHDVITLDLDPRFGADIQADVLTWNPGTLPWVPDVIWASPPCSPIKAADLADPAYVPCHEPAPRGSTTGVQGMANSATRAQIPKALVAEIIQVCEAEA